MTLRVKIASAIAAVPLIIGAFSAPPASAQAFGTSLRGGLEAAAPQELKGVSDPAVIIGNVVSALIGVLGAVLFIYLLWGGYKYMTAGGEPNKVKEGTDTIRNAIIGIVIVSLSYAIASYVLERLAGATTSEFSAQQTQ